MFYGEVSVWTKDSHNEFFSYLCVLVLIIRFSGYSSALECLLLTKPNWDLNEISILFLGVMIVFYHGICFTLAGKGFDH